jgi:hypothetical protein
MLDFDRKQILRVHIPHCSAFQALHRSAQTPVRKLSELMFVEQEPGTAAAMNLAVFSQPSGDLSAFSLLLVHEPSSSAEL